MSAIESKINIVFQKFKFIPKENTLKTIFFGL